MSIITLALLACIQGVTEFLPVSSSAHLILLPSLFGQEDQGVLIDIAIHTGSLLAVLIYFRSDVQRLAAALLRPPRDWQADPDGRLATALILASLPIFIAAAVIYYIFDIHGLIRSGITILAIMNIIFAGFLFLADRYGGCTLTADRLQPYHGLLIGLAQIAALIPGASRSGVVITAARGLGLPRHAAARIGMLSSIPVLAGFGAAGFIEVIRVDTGMLLMAIWAALLAAIVAWLVIGWFMRMVQRFSLLPFVVYRLLLGALLLLVEL